MYGQPEIGTDDRNLKKAKDYKPKDIEQSDYCEIGLDHCKECGWTGTYPVSGCPVCHESFVA